MSARRGAGPGRGPAGGQTYDGPRRTGRGPGGAGAGGALRLGGLGGLPGGGGRGDAGGRERAEAERVRGSGATALRGGRPSGRDRGRRRAVHRGVSLGHRGVLLGATPGLADHRLAVPDNVEGIDGATRLDGLGDQDQAVRAAGQGLGVGLRHLVASRVGPPGGSGPIAATATPIMVPRAAPRSGYFFRSGYIVGSLATIPRSPIAGPGRGAGAARRGDRRSISAGRAAQLSKMGQSRWRIDHRRPPTAPTPRTRTPHSSLIVLTWSLAALCTRFSDILTALHKNNLRISRTSNLTCARSSAKEHRLVKPEVTRSSRVGRSTSYSPVAQRKSTASAEVACSSRAGGATS